MDRSKAIVSGAYTECGRSGIRNGGMSCPDTGDRVAVFDPAVVLVTGVTQRPHNFQWYNMVYPTNLQSRPA